MICTLFFIHDHFRNFEAHECVMVGDDLRDDVEGALNAGISGFLVRTGKYRPEDETKIKQTNEDIKVFHTVNEVIDLVLS